MIRLLAIDMDGTCLNDRKQISAQTMQALKEAARAGITVVPTTGRSLSCIPHQLKNETFFRYVISSNGAVVTDRYTGENLYEALIPNNQAVAFLKRCKNLGVSVHMNHDFILQGHLLRLVGKISYGADAENTRCTPNAARLLEQEKTDAEEIQLFYFTERSRQKAMALLSEYDCFLKSFSGHYVELYSRQASKGNALQALTEHLHLMPEQVACIGDAENDLSMFAVSGMKLAMGNSIERLKQQADAVLPSNNDSGVGYGITRYVLKDCN